MSIFTDDYTIKTSKGDYLIPIFNYVGDLSDVAQGEFLSGNLVTYHGQPISNLDTEYYMSTLRVGLYSGVSPEMGTIDILNADDIISDFGIFSTGFYPPVSGWMYQGVNISSADSSEESRDFVRCSCPVIIVDNNDHVMFSYFWLRNREESISYTENTASQYGYAAGKNNQAFSFTRAYDPYLFSNANEILSDLLHIFRDRSDPYEEGGTAGTGGGTGNFDGTGDLISIPSLPDLSAADTGFITLFNPTLSQLQSLASYMWSSSFDIDTFKKIFADPMDCILGLSIVPVNVPTGGSRAVKVGNISTGVNMNVATSQYIEVDCGSLNVNEYWGAYIDYDPYTKAEIYLPYIGTHAIAVDDIMGKSVHVVYHVDILSGACVAFVQCGGTVLYSFIGQCSSSIPITGSDWTSVINGVLTIAGSIGSMVATGGASAPMASAAIASTAVNSFKPNIEKSGAMSGTGGMLAVQTPYLVLTRPRQALPQEQNTFTGYPSYITEQLSELSGYTEIEKIHLENIPATSSELSEIEQLLKSGVIF